MVRCFSAGCRQRVEVELELLVLAVVPELLVHHAWLDVPVVLVFLAGVLSDGPDHLMIGDLANPDTTVDANRLDREHFNGPVPTESSISHARRAMDE